MRQFTEVTLKVTIEKPYVTETRQLLVQAVDTIHESNFVFEYLVTEKDVPAPMNADEGTEEEELAEERIYVIVPMTVQVTPPDSSPRSIQMEPGRLMAQCAHIASKMRAEQTQKGDWDTLHNPITTIVLSVRNSRELKMIREALINDSLTGTAGIESDRRYNVSSFHDSNPPFYGTEESVLTAICTTPVCKADVDAVIGHLELYA
jgi:peptidyl-tRNA hydrolase